MGKKTGRPRGRPKTRDLSSTSVKIEKEASFVCELLSNHLEGKPIRRIVEDAVKGVADQHLRYGPNGRMTWVDMWDPRESVRELRKLGVDGWRLDASGMTTRRFLRAHWWLFYTDPACTKPRQESADLLFSKLPLYVNAWRAAGEAEIHDAIAKDLKAAGLSVPKRHE